MKIGIFGGCFNPPHKMHKKIAEELIEKRYIDKLIFVPTGDSYEKDELALFEHRFKMLELMIENNSNLEVSSISKDDNYKYTFQVLDYFQKLYPKDDIYFVCGTDNLSYFNEWNRYEYILNNYKLLIVDREEKLDSILNEYKKYKDRIIVTDIQTDNLSSTIIRNKIKNGENVNEFIEKNVENYTRENRLY